MALRLADGYGCCRLLVDGDGSAEGQCDVLAVHDGVEQNRSTRAVSRG